MRNYLIFDLDGTLIDSNPTCISILQDMLNARGVPGTITPQQAAPHMSRGGAQMVAALLGPACGDPQEDIKEFRQRYALRDTPMESLFAGVTQGLKRLRDAGYGLAVCSNKPDNLCRKVLTDTALVDLFELVVGARPGLRPKPAPDLLNAVLDALGVPAHRCRFIGDSEIDHRVASDAGMPFYFMTYGYAAAGWRPDCTGTFDDFDQLVEALLSAR